MAKEENTTQNQDGNIGLVQQLADGRIIQLGLTPLQTGMLNAFLVQLSKETQPIMRMSEKYDLVLKSSVKVLRKTK